MTKIQITETVLCDIRFRDWDLVCLFLSLEHSRFEFVSDSDIRISNLNIWCHRSRQSQLTLTQTKGRGFPETTKELLETLMKTEMTQKLQTKNDPARYSHGYTVVVVLFVTCLVTANIMSVKLINIFGLVLPAGVLIFPISYITGDVLTEVYGYTQARRVIWLGFFCNFVVVIAIWVGKVIPPAAFWEGQSAYELILGYTPRLLMASFLAYLVGEFFNAFIMAKMKILTKGRWLWTRTISSTLVGQGLDSMVFISLAFLGTIPIKALVLAIITQWLVKSAYEAIATPLTYISVRFLKKHEGLDVYDYDTRFNPLFIRKE